ncbi:FAD-dependent oxidoreductase, partial [Acinetobacter baumannii]
SDGLSKFPYIREARRVIAKKTIVEKDIVAAGNPFARSPHCADTLGIGLYPVDIHGMQEVPGAGQQTRPFQIPMSALIPEH